jgi:hypothetical protein
LASSAFRRFVEAVAALSDDPAPENLERYLEASRALEESRRRPPPSRGRRPRAYEGEKQPASAPG